MYCMDVQETGELQIIQNIACKIGEPDGLIVGIGDDACVIDVSEENRLVVTTDMLIESTHFDTRLLSPEQLGYKSAAVNISDIAAMGSRPGFALISIGIPPQTQVNFIESFYDGFLACLNETDTILAGGDTTNSPILTISVTLIGFAGRSYLKRSTAQPGDGIYVSGTLGDSAAGLSILQNKLQSADQAGANYLTNRHLRPEPRIALGLALSNIASSAIDISDGIGTDLRHICEASGVGATIYESELPISGSLRELGKINNIDITDLAVSGGEDYELLFTLPPTSEPPSDISVPITKIGEITTNPEICLIMETGEKQPLGKGYEHFRS